MPTIDFANTNDSGWKLQNGVPEPLPEEPCTKMDVDEPFPSYGDPDFFSHFFEWVILELRFSVNWITVISGVLDAVLFFQAHIVSGNVLAMIVVALGALQVFAREQGNKLGSNWQKADFKARDKLYAKQRKQERRIQELAAQGLTVRRWATVKLP